LTTTDYSEVHVIPDAAVKYPLMEHFYTIQGEGANTGKPAYFLRLGGCDVGCVWCDVKESWEAEKHPPVSVKQMVHWVKQAGAVRCVITGGEPLIYDLGPLTRELKKHEIETMIETSGAHPFSGEFDWVCFSPKKFKNPHESIYRYADELKIIVYHKSDLAWGLDHASRVKKECRLFFQPEWSREKEMLPLIIDFVKQHPAWTISLQTHKYMDIP
jgi:organic radical activating enzyme